MKPTFLAGWLLVVGILFSGSVMATAQASDVIVLDGKPAMLFTNPLAKYLAEHPDSLPKSDYVSSGNWRGYIATWEVLDGKLFLRKVDVTLENPDAKPDTYDPITKNVLQAIFPGATDVVADWYSGTLIVPRGNILRYVHMGYGSTYENYSVLSVESGVISKRRDFTAKEFEKFRKSQFEAYKLSEEYLTKYRELQASDTSTTDKSLEDFLYNFESERYLSIDFGKTK